MTRLKSVASERRRRWTTAPALIASIVLLLIQLTILSHISLAASQETAATDAVPPPPEQKQPAPEHAGQVTVIAPKFLRPNSDYHVLVNLANSQAPATVDIQLIGARDSDREQTEAKSVLAHPNETQTVKFNVTDWPPAEYVLAVNVQAVDKSWSFKDEKPITYQAKSFSAFIQTDKAIYKPGQLVQFRVLALTSTLTPLTLKNEINATIEDPDRNVIKQWQYLSNYRGLLSLELPLSDDPMLGDYTIRVSARGQEFVKSFTVAEYVLPTFDVDIQLPAYATYNESDIVATVRASYTYGKPVSGHVTLTVQPLVRFSLIDTRPMEQAQYRARLEPDGSADFQVDVVKDLKQQVDLFEREIEFFALVEEDLTGRKYNKTRTIKIHADKIKIERLDKDNPLKPGLPMLVRYKVAYQDDVPVEDNGPEVELKYSVLGEPFKQLGLRPVGGLIEHQLELPAKIMHPANADAIVQAQRVEVEIRYRNQPHYLDSIKVLQTESRQYMQIYLPQLQRIRRRAGGSLGAAARPSVSVNDQLSVLVRSTEPMQQVTCQGFSKGDIVWALSKRVDNKTELEFEIKIEARMAPQSRILCFYVRPENKELIADSVEVGVTSGLVKNLVKLSTSRDEAKPGQEVEVSVFTKSNSLVGILAIDQSVLLLKSGNDLSSKEILDDLKSYGSSAAAGDERPRVWRWNTASLIEEADVVVLTNGLVYQGAGYGLYRKFPNPNIFQTVAFSAVPEMAAMSSKIMLNSALLDHKLQPPEFHLNKPRQTDPIRIRSVFPETWLWQNGTADSSGQIKFSAKIPDTITTWQLSAFSMHEAHGLALSSGKNSVRVFRPFFIKLNLPYSIIRGEVVNIQAVIFNYGKRPMAATVTLDNQRNEFVFVEAASNTIGDERLDNSTLTQTRLVQVPAQAGASVSFLIKPTKLGHIDIKVLAQGDLVGDGVVKKLLVKAEGQTQHFNKAMLIQLAGPHSSWRKNISIPVPANAVPGSQRVQVSAIGDILGAGLSNLDDLLRLPYGCGEQNMVNLVPNIVILNYLKSTGRLRDFQRDRATRNIQVGYQRQLNYKRSDGSFSAFGQADANGSVWLTGYVLKTLQQARDIITVDERVIKQAAEFLVRHSAPDGSIQEVGMLHHKELASSSLDDSAGGGKPATARSIYLTAYTLVALMQKRAPSVRPDGAEQGADSGQVLERGLDFLERQLAADGGAGTQLSTYELAIIGYALQLAGDKRRPAADRAYELLWARAIEQPVENQVHWSNRPAAAAGGALSAGESEAPAKAEAPADERPESSPRSARHVAAPPLKEFGVKSDQSAHLFVPDSLDVEMSSWALLNAVRRNELERALPIVRWLVAKQNSLGGFASTQDTVLAIEALANYAQASALSTGAAGGQAQSIEVEFVHPLGGASGAGSSAIRRHGLEQVLISRQNALVQQQTRLPDDTAWVQVQASGVGSAVVQVSWQYNLLVSAERPAFYLNPTLDRSSSANYLQLSVCTYYKAGDPADKLAASNMAVAEIELPSGYAADAEALQSLKRHAQVKRVETQEGETRVLVYLDRVGRDELCFTVPAHRSSRVANNKPVPVTIYDYYRREQAARIFYKPPAASSCDICESDSCSESCSAGGGGDSSAKQSGKLVSLHEQRRERQQQQQRQGRLLGQNATSRHLDGPAGDRAASLIEPNNSTTAAGGQLSALSLLPISSAFSALNQAAKNVSLHF
jgi:CD109 antigen